MCSSATLRPKVRIDPGSPASPACRRKKGGCTWRLAVPLDLYSRRLVGLVGLEYRALHRTHPRPAVLCALKRAIRMRRPEPGLLHYSDRGSQYAAYEYQARLAEAQGTSSPEHGSEGRKGNCYDNAVVERERIHQFTGGATGLEPRRPTTSATIIEFLQPYKPTTEGGGIHSFIHSSAGVSAGTVDFENQKSGYPNISACAKNRGKITAPKRE
jgi:transposase InsO family protein